MTGSANTSAPVVCRDCDRLHLRPSIAPREVALCSRCGGVLARGGHDVATRTFAYTLASLVLLCVANAFPFLEFGIAGRVHVARLITGVGQLYSDGYGALAAMVLFTSLLAPLALLVGMLSLTGPMLMQRRYRWMRPVAKFVGNLRIWSMLEVFLLGVIVSSFKLTEMADLLVGPALFGFVGLILTSTAAIAAYEPSIIWEYLGREEGA